MEPGINEFGVSGVGGELLGVLDGAGGYQSYDAFCKALTTNAGLTTGGSDVALLEGGAALRVQSLDPIVKRTIPLEPMFILFNMLATGKAGAVLDEWIRQMSIGGVEGQTFVGELDDLPTADEEYVRKVGNVKFQMTQREVSMAKMAEVSVIDALAGAQMGGIRQLKQDAEYALIYGDSVASTFEPDGILKQIRDHGDPELTFDARGGGLSSMGDEVINLSTKVQAQGRFGRITTALASIDVATSEFDQKLKPAMRIALDDSTADRDLTMGATVGGVKTIQGKVKLERDIFLTESLPPFEARGGKYADFLTSNPLLPPTAVGDGAAGAPVVAASVDSKFALVDEGTYYYAVCSIGKGRSTGVVAAQVTVAAGDHVTITITNPNDAGVKGYEVYRGRRNGTNALADLRSIARIARVGASGANTTFVDNNKFLPGTSPVILLNLAPESSAIGMRRLYPITQFPLARLRATTRIGMVHFWYLQMGIIEHHALIENVLPANARWNPRG